MKMLWQQMEYFLQDFSTKKKLWLGGGNGPMDYLSVLVHESCHMDQFLEDSDIWSGSYVEESVDPMSLLFLARNNIINLTKQQALDISMKTAMLELDCEKRSVEKIKKYSIPIDLDEYRRTANSYVFFYLVLAEKKEWWNLAPYYIPEIVNICPTEFLDEYTSTKGIGKKICDQIRARCF